MTERPKEMVELSKTAVVIVDKILLFDKKKPHCVYTGQEIPQIPAAEMSVGTSGYRWMGFDYIRVWIAHMQNYRVNILRSKTSELYGYAYSTQGMYRVKADVKESES